MQDAIFRVVAAILHLGNVEFAKGNETDSSEPKDDKSRFHLKIAAELFMFVTIILCTFVNNTTFEVFISERLSFNLQFLLGVMGNLLKILCASV